MAETEASASLPAVGCVSYLNAKPLIHGVDGAIARVRFDVPARMLDGLLGGVVELALCPVIDAYRSPEPLVIVPVGAIGCSGPTWTVRLFSRVPIAEVARVYADTDSHTSVTLLRVLMRERYGRAVEVVGLDARAEALPADAQAVLLIGDKVVTSPPPASRFGHELDLGEAWQRLTGLPFVFAVWMARQGAELGGLPGRLAAQLALNQGRIDALVAEYAGAHGWPAELARRYLGRVLRYRMGEDALAGLRRFAELAERGGLIASPRREPPILRC